jgi:hypothetical protein
MKKFVEPSDNRRDRETEAQNLKRLTAGTRNRGAFAIDGSNPC